MSEKEKENMTPQEQFEDFVEFLEEQNNKNDNIFDILGASNWEIRHSKFLAWLLNPNASHGLGSYFLEQVLSNIHENHDIKFNKIDNKKVSVKTELSNSTQEENNNFDETCNNQTPEQNDENVKGKKEKNKKQGKRRIDIFVEGENFTITIENKYGTGEHDGQLKAYKDWVNTNYNNKNYTNFFIYIDLYKPNDFDDENKTNPYLGYKYIGYNSIKDLLNPETINEILNKNEKEQDKKDKIKSIIEDYKNCISQTIDIENDEILKYIIDNERFKKLFDYVEKLKDKDLSEKEKNAKYTLLLYKRKIKHHNDEKIKGILEQIIDNNDTYSAKSHSKKDYAYVIRRNDENPLFAELGQIDYTADDNNLKICMYSGLNKYTSASLIDYIKKNSDFFSNLTKLPEKLKWTVNFGIKIKYKGTNHDFAFLQCDYKNELIQNFLRENNLLTYPDTNTTYINLENKATQTTQDICSFIKNLNDTYKENKNCSEQLNLFENFDNIYNKIKKYEPKTKKENKSQPELVIRWELDMVYNTGINFIYESKEEELKKTYINKTLDGLEVLGHDEDFCMILSDNAKKLVDNKEKYKKYL